MIYVMRIVCNCGKPFTASANFRFSCVNEGYIDAPVLPGLKLARCRLEP
ncbi:hypothetical protein BamMEX5DRAFT_1891 [Burkholderia ambifaria MEX-5]|uniref:Uncharacterized protein n=1 Tax=Burkholderia ambifaria MEX-5 TaxID=396597 RepID=B1T275_9BURK|nr:hypothetical protein BamMEX5DRAFT_1891 [Burkholderia ambifaria MEX-5]